MNKVKIDADYLDYLKRMTKIAEKEVYAEALQIKFKKLHPAAVTPTRATDGSAGWDLTASEWACVNCGFDNNLYAMYHTGIAVEIPAGYMGLLFPRSSCFKRGLSLANSVGVIDSDYRGEICFIYKGCGMYQKGDRIGQLVIVPCPDVELVEVEELSQTERGQGGFGSTGK